MARERLKYIASLLIFGTNGVLPHFIPLRGAEIVVSRCLLGGAALLVIFAVTKQDPDLKAVRSQWKGVVISGASMGLSWMLLFMAYASTGVGTATLAYYCGPVMVMALSPLLFRERLTFPGLAGILAVIAGMVLVNGRDVLTEGFSPGLLCGLGSAVCYALMIISGKGIKDVPGLTLTFTQLFVALLVVGPYALITGLSPLSLNASAVVCVAALGLVNTGLACYLYFSSIRALPAQTVAICSYIDPASALIFSAVLLGERMGPTELAGALLILGGAAFGELAGRRKKTEEAEA